MATSNPNTPLFLTSADQSVLRDVIRRELNNRVNSRYEHNGFSQDVTPEVYCVKLPVGGIPARSGTAVGKAECDVFQIVIGTETDPYGGGTLTMTAVNNPDSTPFKIWIVNIYPVKWYGAGVVDQYLKITRDKYGLWLCEKPPYRTKCKVDADITAGGAGDCTVWKNGIATTDKINVTLDWMHGGAKISATKQAIAEFFEDQNKWIFVGSECV